MEELPPAPPDVLGYPTIRLDNQAVHVAPASKKPCLGGFLVLWLIIFILTFQILLNSLARLK